jgi:hypothetical protein
VVAAVGVDLGSDAVDLSFSRPPLSERPGQPLLLAMGDPVAGPLLGLFYDRPATPEELAGPPDLTPAHSHSCDSFRLCLRGELIVGQQRYAPGGFRFQRAGRPYGRDGDAPHVDGNWRTILFADRRGHLVRPTDPALRAQAAAAAPEIAARYGPLLPVLLDDDDPGVAGLVTDLGEPSAVGHVDGSFAGAGRWSALPDGTRVTAARLGLPELGPIVLLLRTPPGAVALGATTWGTDAVHLVAAGTGLVAGGAVRAAGDVRVQGPGTPWAEVVAGPGGVDHLLVLGDRRGAQPEGARTAWHDAVLGRVDALALAAA